MKKTLVTLLLACMLVGCGNKQSDEIIGGADEPTSIILESDSTKDDEEEPTGETFNVKDYFEIGE
ncbi:hypothetical protein SAMN02910384_02876 [Pseudobutyrivibrio sp. ACV-2]|uniref:hypothetical protein n=1 Tax=Pseudobutyrivibrio sp. ACV-2 TaxID=1520801 RepID=UPI00089A0DA0|nr:hypothetical protein [Pseudobutyrivibrio sp. ACV-2]SEA96733.1 hypothetical protein SAMN02910384_02876 [Pseudobutyrivibrio sp. ACV-2]